MQGPSRAPVGKTILADRFRVPARPLSRLGHATARTRHGVTWIILYTALIYWRKNRNLKVATQLHILMKRTWNYFTGQLLIFSKSLFKESLYSLIIGLVIKYLWTANCKLQLCDWLLFLRMYVHDSKKYRYNMLVFRTRIVFKREKSYERVEWDTQFSMTDPGWACQRSLIR